MRVWLLLAFSGITSACDPTASAAIQLAPHPVPESDSTTAAAFFMVGRIASRHGLAPASTTDAEGKNRSDWKECWAKPYLFLCGKIRDREAQFHLRQPLASGFSPSAERLWKEVSDSLRGQFGEQRIIACRWRGAADPQDVGCAPLPRLTPSS